MTTKPEQLTDDLMQQAVCVVFVGNSTATGWLFSDDGHLMTVGHVFDEVGPSNTSVEVQFLGEARLNARRLYKSYNKDTADDFAILKIENEDAIAGRKPLPVAFVRSVEGSWKLQGYGRTLVSLSAGRGSFIGLANLQSHDDFFF